MSSADNSCRYVQATATITRKKVAGMEVAVLLEFLFTLRVPAIRLAPFASVYSRDHPERTIGEELTISRTMHSVPALEREEAFPGLGCLHSANLLSNGVKPNAQAAGDDDFP
jgi:hypothetical protein